MDSDKGFLPLESSCLDVPVKFLYEGQAWQRDTPEEEKMQCLLQRGLVGEPSRGGPVREREGSGSPGRQPSAQRSLPAQVRSSPTAHSGVHAGQVTQPLWASFFIYKMGVIIVLTS